MLASEEGLIAYQLEEERSLVCLQCGLGIRSIQGAVDIVLREQSRGRRQFLDELPEQHQRTCSNTWPPSVAMQSKEGCFFRREDSVSTHLLESLVIDKAGRILRHLKLALLNLLAKLPGARHVRVSGSESVFVELDVGFGQGR